MERRTHGTGSPAWPDRALGGGFANLRPGAGKYPAMPGGQLRLGVPRFEQEPQPVLVRHARLWQPGEGQASSIAQKAFGQLASLRHSATSLGVEVRAVEQLQRDGKDRAQKYRADEFG